MNPERAQAFAATMQEELEEYGAEDRRCGVLG